MSDETPLLDELERGPWPSYVKEIKRAAKKNAAAKDLLRIQEQSYRRQGDPLEARRHRGRHRLRFRRHRQVLR